MKINLTINDKELAEYCDEMAALWREVRGALPRWLRWVFDIFRRPELKSCPFCGGAMKLSLWRQGGSPGLGDYWTVGCPVNCHYQMHRYSRAKAVAAANKRPKRWYAQ